MTDDTTGYVFVSDLGSSADDNLKSHDKQFWKLTIAKYCSDSILLFNWIILYIFNLPSKPQVLSIFSFDFSSDAFLGIGLLFS